MDNVGFTEREWIHELSPQEARVRCRYRRSARRIVEYTVQLEILYQGDWRPVVRFDNAHGFCHRDELHPDGSQVKAPYFAGDANETFTTAIEDIQSHWESHMNRYLREIKP